MRTPTAPPMFGSLRALAILVGLVLIAATPGRADEKSPVPLRVQLVLARYQGDKKVSNLPYTLTVNANVGKTSLRLGSQIPVITSVAASGALTSSQYKDVGTNIDCTAVTLEDGRFKIDLSIEDLSVYGEDQLAGSSVKIAGGQPSFKRFSSVNTVIMKDGQTTQLTLATDKMNGEVTRVEVTLNVLK